jgi:wobble nucleotide-excising tRNase
MKITRINKAVGYRIFRDFTWPATGLTDFGQFNLVYGWNGTGKTSLSNLFRSIERRSPLTEGSIEVQVDDRRVAGGEFSTAALPPVRTFNRDTVDRSIFEASTKQLPPVYFLGEDSVEKQKLVEKLKDDLRAAMESEAAWVKKGNDADSALESYCSDQARVIKNLLTVSGGGPYNNYNSATFKTDAQALLTRRERPSPLTEEQRNHHLSTKDGVVMDRVTEPSITFPDLIDLVARSKDLLGRSVASTALAELASSANLSAWVSTGIGLHRGTNNSTVCRFCDQPVPEERLQRLEAHFNDEFKKFVGAIDSLIAEIQTGKKFVETLRAPAKEALYANLRSQYSDSLAKLEQHASTVAIGLEELIRSLNTKRSEPFKALEFSVFFTVAEVEAAGPSRLEQFLQIVFTGVTAVSAALGKSAFDRLAQIISQHNLHTQTFDVQVKQARDALATDEVLRALPALEARSADAASAKGQTSTARAAVAKLKAEITKLEVQIRQHRRPAEELNREITSYLGRDELRFEVEENGYRITRGGQPAMHLSDGERTAIAFLYFLKSLSGTDFDINNGVVVIDDPVSSLDANSLFCAFGYMKQRTIRAGQLFILTHNFTFFRQVRNWFCHLKGQGSKDPEKRPAKFYMLASNTVGGSRTARLELLDPFLHQYESEYHYLFKRVHEEAFGAAAAGMESYYAMPNIARRLLESFLAFRLPNVAGELFNKLESVDFDPAKRTRMLRFLHTYSHFDRVSEDVHDLSVLAETPAILRDVLELMKTCDASHFGCMEQLLAPLAEAA